MTALPCVFIVEDDQAVAHSFQWLIQSVGLSVEVYPSASTFLEAYTADRPGCLLLDVRMPGMSGLELQERLLSKGCTLPIIIITGYGDVPMAARAFKAGALDFLEKPVSDQLLLDRVHEALEVDKRQREEQAVLADMSTRLGRLSSREKTVLSLVVEGKPSKAIAAQLGITPKTVEAHRAKIMRKTQAGSIAELVRMAVTLSLKGDSVSRSHAPAE